MNAIINLNHFCEIHGPQTIFSTQTVRDPNNSNSVNPGSTPINHKPCSACGSVGNKVIFMSRDKESSIMFVSSEKSIFGKEYLRSVALRSLSCEVNFIRLYKKKSIWNFLNNLIFFLGNSQQSGRSRVLWRFSSEFLMLYIQGQRYVCERIRETLFDSHCNEGQNVSTQYATISGSQY